MAKAIGLSARVCDDVTLMERPACALSRPPTVFRQQPNPDAIEGRCRYRFAQEDRGRLGVELVALRGVGYLIREKTSRIAPWHCLPGVNSRSGDGLAVSILGALVTFLMIIDTAVIYQNTLVESTLPTTARCWRRHGRDRRHRQSSTMAS